MRLEGKLRLETLTDEDAHRMVELMKKYQDRPMDVADASLVAIAERLGIQRVFTVDRDFYIYRMKDGSAFEVIS